MRIRNYRVITDTDIGGFQEKVKELIDGGWEPIGSLQVVSATGDQTNDQFFQAMVQADESVPRIEDSLNEIAARTGN